MNCLDVFITVYYYYHNDLTTETEISEVRQGEPQDTYGNIWGKCFYFMANFDPDIFGSVVIWSHKKLN